jgi:hypothetical protein
MTLDHLVWTEIVRLLEDPRLIQKELERSIRICGVPGDSLEARR